MKLVDPTIKIITFTHETIDSSDEFPLENSTSVFKEIFKCSKSSRVYESAIPLIVIKYGNKNQLSNIFATLVNRNAYFFLTENSNHIKNTRFGF